MEQINHPEFFRKKQVILITGYYGMRSYTFATQLLFMQAAKGKQFLHFSSLKSERGLNIYVKRYKNELGLEDYVAVNYEVADYPFFSTNQIYKIVEKVVRKRKLDVIFFDDFLNLIDLENKENTARFLKDIAVAFEVSIVVNHFMKPPKRKKNPPSQKAIKKSLPAFRRTIVNYADVILLLHRPYLEDIDCQQEMDYSAPKLNTVSVSIAKNRNEALYDFTVGFLEQKRVFQFN